jgi:cytochrome c553
MCQACHGLDGLSKTPDAPNIAGQTEPYLVVQLQAFKSGERKNDAMSVVAPSLSVGNRDQHCQDAERIKKISSRASPWRRSFPKSA